MKDCVSDLKEVVGVIFGVHSNMVNIFWELVIYFGVGGYILELADISWIWRIYSGIGGYILELADISWIWRIYSGIGGYWTSVNKVDNYPACFGVFFYYRASLGGLSVKEQSKNNCSFTLR